MRSSLVVRASDCQCTSCNGPGFDPSIRRYSGIRGAADEAVLNIVCCFTLCSHIKKDPVENLYKIFLLLFYFSAIVVFVSHTTTTLVWGGIYTVSILWYFLKQTVWLMLCLYDNTPVPVQCTLCTFLAKECLKSEGNIGFCCMNSKISTLKWLSHKTDNIWSIYNIEWVLSLLTICTVYARCWCSSFSNKEINTFLSKNFLNPVTDSPETLPARRTLHGRLGLRQEGSCWIHNRDWSQRQILDLFYLHCTIQHVAWNLTSWWWYQELVFFQIHRRE